MSTTIVEGQECSGCPLSAVGRVKPWPADDWIQYLCLACLLALEEDGVAVERFTEVRECATSDCSG